MKLFDLTFKFECLGFVATCGQNITLYLALLPTLVSLSFWSATDWDIIAHIFSMFLYYRYIKPRNLTSGFVSWTEAGGSKAFVTVERWSMSVTNFLAIVYAMTYFVSRDEVMNFCLETQDPISCASVVILFLVRFLEVVYTYYNIFVFSALLLFESASYKQSKSTVASKPCLVCKNVFEQVAVSLHSAGNIDQYVCQSCCADLIKIQVN